jgi:hypothetical protein
MIYPNGHIGLNHQATRFDRVTSENHGTVVELSNHIAKLRDPLPENIGWLTIH